MNRNNSPRRKEESPAELEEFLARVKPCTRCQGEGKLVRHGILILCGRCKGTAIEEVEDEL